MVEPGHMIVDVDVDVDLDVDVDMDDSEVPVYGERAGQDEVDSRGVLSAMGLGLLLALTTIHRDEV